jgi:hypothetical protein
MRASSSALRMKLSVSTGKAPWPRPPAGITNVVNLRPGPNPFKRRKRAPYACVQMRAAAPGRTIRLGGGLVTTDD